MTYNIIGDIHGRDVWYELVRDDAVNIFVGDYFDPYEPFSFAQVMHNFRMITDYKRRNPDTVLLYGNHDLHYLLNDPYERYSRYNAEHSYEIRYEFEQVRDLMNGVAYSIGDDVLVTHAGVSKPWYEKWIGSYNDEATGVVARNINDLWDNDMSAFNYGNNSGGIMDRGGMAPTSSPMWIRPGYLKEYNIFTDNDYRQVVGHTQQKNISRMTPKLTFVDCLMFSTKSYVIEK